MMASSVYKPLKTPQRPAPSDWLECVLLRVFRLTLFMIFIFIFRLIFLRYDNVTEVFRDKDVKESLERVQRPLPQAFAYFTVDNAYILHENGSENYHTDWIKFDCLPRGDVWDKKECLSRGCLWEKSDIAGVPWCFYPQNYTTYTVVNHTRYKYGESLFLKNVLKSPYPKDVSMLKITIDYCTKNSLRVKITDAVNHRFEPPYPEKPAFFKKGNESNDYEVIVDEEKFGFAIVRKQPRTILFDTRNAGGFIFANQFLQISAFLPSKFIYGLGENKNNFLRDMNFTRVTLFNHDSPPIDNKNMYGSHPFYLSMEESGLSHGVFLLNSNAMDVILQPDPAITYRTIGGCLDFFFFLGPKPGDVVIQYTDVIGKPFMPPSWSLGFHFSRFGFKSPRDMDELVTRNLNVGVPIDVIWNDIDYMKDRNDFTLNDNFKDLPDYVRSCHDNGLKYVMIIDPGISSKEPAGTYAPYDNGLLSDIFVKNATGSILEGKVWNSKGGTVFPDFTNPYSVPYWVQLVKDFHKILNFDGIWLDMNDISNFVDGSTSGCPVDNVYDNPPYIPGVDGGKLTYKTVCMSASHYAGLHYDVHNLYGLAETMVTTFALAEIRRQRPFVLSRSTFPGHGHYSAHWTGDVFSTWDDMERSIGDIMTFNIFGIPMVGADICGFNGNTTVELCARWSQLGAFYPFARNHNTDDAIDQDPASLGPSVSASAWLALFMRFLLRPYLYTLFWEAHDKGYTVARPLFFEFPEDKNTYGIRTQFMWGSGLLIVPVTKPGAVSVNAYFPKGWWFSAVDKNADKIESEGQYLEISAPLDVIPVYFRGGSVIPLYAVMNSGVNNATMTRGYEASGYNLFVILDEQQKAAGSFYYDDGETYKGVSADAETTMEYSLVNYEAGNGTLKSMVEHKGYLPEKREMLNSVIIFGLLAADIDKVLVDGETTTHWKYEKEAKELSVDVTREVASVFTVSWLAKTDYDENVVPLKKYPFRLG